MESSNSRISFLQQMLQNKFLLLTVMLAVFAIIFFGIGLIALLTH